MSDRTPTPLTTSSGTETTMALTKLQDREGLIYIITDGVGHFKIGVTNCQGLDDRLSSLQTGNAFRLRVVHQRLCPLELSFHIETMAHQLLAASRVRGEWFRGTQPGIVAAVDECVDRAMSMDDAIEDLFVIAAQQMEFRKPVPVDRTDLEEAIHSDTKRKDRITGLTRGVQRGIFS